MAITFNFYIPQGLKDTQDVRDIEKLLDKIKNSRNISVNRKIINDSEEEHIKNQFLWRLSVVKRIGIKKTIRTKSLYPQLVIFNENTPVTFYPQTYGNQHISIQKFLEDLLKGNVECLHDKEEIQSLLNGLMDK